MRSVVLVVLWIATLGVAYYLGSSLGRGGSGALPEPGGLPGDREAVTPAGPETPASPILAPGPRTRVDPPPSRMPPRLSAAEEAVEVVRMEDLPPFTLEDVTDPEEAMARLLTYARSLLAGGKAGHLELLRLLDAHIVRNKDLQRLFGDDRRSARYVYPWLKLVVEQEDQVVGLMETVFETMAEEPTFFAEFDDNTLEVFTEPMAMILPGVVDETQLTRFRRWAEIALENTKTTEVNAVKRQSSELKRALEVWAPPLSGEEALTKLESGELAGWEAVQALRRLSPEQAARVEIGPLLEEAVKRGDGRVLHALQALPLTSRDLALLDQAILDRARTEWVVRTYLRNTGRGGWPAAQRLVEAGLVLPPNQSQMFALVLKYLDPKPPADYVRWVLDTHALSDGVVKTLKSAFELE